MKSGLNTCAMIAVLMMAAVALSGCGSNQNGGDGGEASGGVALLPSEYITSEAPGEASDVLDARDQLDAGETVVLRGRIGGRRDPITGNRAIFLLADVGLPACDANPDDKCPTPWDYCCVPREELRRNLVTVQVVDEDGRPLAARIDPATGIRPGAEVVVEGEVASKDESGGMIINARKIHVAG